MKNKVHPETAQAIANLINSINVSKIWLAHCMQQGPNGVVNRNAIYWQAQEFKDIIRLTEEYGIPHTCYALAVSCMAEEKYANAKLIDTSLTEDK